MSEHIYEENLGKDEQMEEIDFNRREEDAEAEERIVDIYESSGSFRTYKAAAESREQQLPCRTSVRAVALSLVLLCVLLLASLIATALHCRVEPQTHNMSWIQERRQSLTELSDFCKSGCRSFNNSFYYISPDKKSWNSSRQDCKDRGADLVIVNSEEEQEFINSFKQTFWIGLTDREEEGTWRWVDGSLLNSSSFWKKGEPTGMFKGKEEDCGNTFYYNELHSWNDNGCSGSHPWICEKMMDF